MAALSISLALPLLLFLWTTLPFASHSTALNCSDTTRICTSFLAFKTSPSTTSTLIQSMFDATPSDLTADPAASPGYVFICKNCSCAAAPRMYFANTTFTVRDHNGPVFPMISDAYRGLAFMPNTSRRAKVGAVVGLHLLCGCSSGLWNYLMSYVMEEGDTVESLSSRFGVSMDSIETANGMSDPNSIVVGDVYYIPLKSGDTGKHSSKFPYGWVIGSMGVALFLIAVVFLSCIAFKTLHCCGQQRTNRTKDPDQPTSHKRSRFLSILI